jgi:hypothetical protein
VKPAFALVEVDRLRVHEETDARQVRRLVRRLEKEGRVEEPIWVARGSRVILNGHHRYAALRALGARRAPVWLIEYESPEVELGRWTPGPQISKTEVVDRALAGRPFPPKTTRHILTPPPGPRPTSLAELGVPANGTRTAGAHPARPRLSRGGAVAPDSG